MSSLGPQPPYQPWREDPTPGPSGQGFDEGAVAYVQAAYPPAAQSPTPDRYALPPYQPPAAQYAPATVPVGLPKPKVGTMRVVRRVAIAVVVFAVLIAVGVAYRGNRLPFVKDMLSSLVGGDKSTSSDNDPLPGLAVSSQELRAGLCLKTVLGDKASFQTLPVVDCAEKHGGEVVGTFKMPKGKYPGEAGILRKVNEKCPKQILAWAPNLEGKPVAFGFAGPSAAQWKLGNRVVACVVVDPEGDATGSIKD